MGSVSVTTDFARFDTAVFPPQRTLLLCVFVLFIAMIADPSSGAMQEEPPSSQPVEVQSEQDSPVPTQSAQSDQVPNSHEHSAQQETANSGPDNQAPPATTGTTETETSGAGFNIRMRTLGGQQFWTDIHNVGGWRIQRNEVTGHHRLIDSANVRQSWGSLDHCRAKLNAAVESGAATAQEGKVVIIIHGLLRSRRSMATPSEFLSNHGYQVIPFEYASSRQEVAVLAASLNELISGLGPEVTEINFVCHSLGTIILRHYLNDTIDPETGAQGDPRIGRIVMLGPPNQGSRMARLLGNSFIFSVVAGATGTELSTTWDDLEKHLAIPSAEFGIVAGGQDETGGMNNLVLSGQDDFTVSLEETKLPGADDLFVRPLYHGTMMNQPEVLDATLSFLQNGYFTTEEERTRIPDRPADDSEGAPASELGSESGNEARDDSRVETSSESATQTRNR